MPITALGAPSLRPHRLHLPLNLQRLPRPPRALQILIILQVQSPAFTTISFTKLLATTHRSRNTLGLNNESAPDSSSVRFPPPLVYLASILLGVGMRYTAGPLAVAAYRWLKMN
jgi:hypothetical protein